MSNLLFVCSRNQLRSPTGEAVWQQRAGHMARSAGTSPHARHPISPADIRWAEVIFVMEAKHLHRLQAAFPRALQYKRVHCLDIPDDYRFMDPALVQLLEQRVAAVLGAPA